MKQERKQFKKVCITAQRNVPAFAIREEQRTTLFSVGARIYNLTRDEIINTFKELFGFSFSE